jgi:hypothetical protein
MVLRANIENLFDDSYWMGYGKAGATARWRAVRRAR